MTQALRGYAPLAALLGTAIGSYAAIRALAEIPPWIQELIRAQGSDFLMAFSILGALICYAPGFIRAQKDQAVALNSVAESLRNLPQRDDMKFETIIIGQEMLSRGFERLNDRLESIEDKIDGAKT